MSRKRFPRSRGSVGNEPPAYLRDTFFSVRAARLGISLISCAVSRVKGFKEPGMGAKNRKEFRGNVYFLRFFDGWNGREREREYNYNIRIISELYSRNKVLFSFSKRGKNSSTHFHYTLCICNIYHENETWNSLLLFLPTALNYK